MMDNSLFQVEHKKLVTLIQRRLLCDQLPFEYWTNVCSVFKLICYLDVRYSDPTAWLIIICLRFEVRPECNSVKKWVITNISHFFEMEYKRKRKSNSTKQERIWPDMLCISTSVWVLFTGWNHLFQHFNIFFHHKQKNKKKSKKEKNTWKRGPSALRCIS